jgi:hypothetical protein
LSAGKALEDSREDDAADESDPEADLGSFADQLGELLER